MIKVIGVRFRTAGKVYFFDPVDYNIKRGDHVIVETARGVEFGTVVGDPKEVEDDKVIQPLKPVLRIATQKDVEQEAANKIKEIGMNFDLLLVKSKASFTNCIKFLQVCAGFCKVSLILLPVFFMICVSFSKDNLLVGLKGFISS